MTKKKAWLFGYRLGMQKGAVDWGKLGRGALSSGTSLARAAGGAAGGLLFGGGGGKQPKIRPEVFGPAAGARPKQIQQQEPKSLLRT